MAEGGAETRTEREYMTAFGAPEQQPVSSGCYMCKSFLFSFFSPQIKGTGSVSRVQGF